MNGANRSVNEGEFSRQVRSAVSHAGGSCYPVETGATLVGFPDLVIVGAGAVSFVELKSRPERRLCDIESLKLEGPGQRGFAVKMYHGSSYSIGGVLVSRLSFLLVRASDGAMLIAEEEKGRWPCFAWQDSVRGEQLLDALRAHGTRCSPTADMKGEALKDCFNECACIYEAIVGVKIDMSYDEEGMLRGREDALKMARDISDRGMVSLLMRRVKEASADFVPLEGNNGYIIE